MPYCPKHGHFLVPPGDHPMEHGCPKCVQLTPYQNDDGDPICEWCGDPECDGFECSEDEVTDD